MSKTRDSEPATWSVDAFMITPVSHPSRRIASIDVHDRAGIIQKGQEATGFQCQGAAHAVGYS